MLDERNEATLPTTPAAGKGVKFWLAVAAILALGVAGWGVVSRMIKEGRLANWTDAQATPSVELAPLKTGSGGQGLALPGEFKAFYEAQIRARVNGYLKDWKYDIGAHVHAGELLATIDAPDLDQQYEQAKGELARAEAHSQLAKLTSKRWSALRAATVVSQQSVDEKGGDVAAKDADVAAARANVDRLRAMKGFTEIRAPFTGVVTARKIDIGVLVGPGHPVELFDVSDIHELRVYVRVPQPLAAHIKEGMKATLTVSQYPGRKFEAKVIATSQAIATNSRTLLVQLLTDNSSEALFPGSFTEVHFELPSDANIVRVPATALIFRNNQLHVALVDPEMKVTFRKISIERDLGNEVEVSSALKPSDRVINYPSEFLREGQKVIIADKTAASRGDGEK